MKDLYVQVKLLSDRDRSVAEAHLVADARYGLAGVTVRGSSGREPGDKANPVVGENLAVARALRSLANRLERQATGAMKMAESNRQHKEEIARRGLLKKLAEGTGGRGPIQWTEDTAPSVFPPGTFGLPQDPGPYGKLAETPKWG